MNPRISLIAAFTALFLSCVACYRVLRPPTSFQSIYTYDLSSPEAALKSLLQAQADGSVLAKMEMQAYEGVPAARKRKESVQFHKEMESNGQKLLFVSYEPLTKPGEPAPKRTQAVEAFAKDPGSDRWYPAELDRNGMSPDVRKEVEAWERPA